MNDTSIPSLESLLAHRRWVQGVARRLLRDEQAAEDLAQETWVRAMRSPPDPERDPKPWLRRVLKNLASNVRRGEGRRRSYESSWRESREQRSPEALVAEAEQHKRLVNLLMDLEEPFKTALVLRFYEGLGPKEIAERLDVPVGTVHSRIARAVERMKTRLDEEEGGNRKAWIAGLLPLAGFDRYAPAAAATATTTSLAGILAMTLTKPKVALLSLLLVGCLVSGGLWLAAESRSEDPADADVPPMISLERPATLKGRSDALLADAGTSSAEDRPEQGAPEIADGGIVRGTVLDAAGVPLSGAEVYVLPVGAPGLEDEDLEKPRYGRQVTTPEGLFEIPLGDIRSARLLAFAKGHTAGTIRMDQVEPGTPVEIVLGRPWRVRVRVADGEGRWPAGCRVDLHSHEPNTLDRAVDPRQQYFDVELGAPEVGNVQEVPVHRAGEVWAYAYPPRGMAAIPAMVKLTQPADEVTIRVLRSGELTLRLLDASTGEPIPADLDFDAWMGHRAEGVTVLSVGFRGPMLREASRIAPGTFDLEVSALGYEPWSDKITIHTEGEKRTLDVRLTPLRPDLDEGRLRLRVSGEATASEELLEMARFGSPSTPGTERYAMFARMREGDLEAWTRIWGTSGGWADLDLVAQEDGSIEVRQSLYPVTEPRMPAGSYDLYVAERGTGRAAFLPGIRVFGDQENRYDVPLEPGTMISSVELLRGDDVFTGFEVRAAATGRLPLIALQHNGSQEYNTPHTLAYLLRAPRQPQVLGPFPAKAVEVTVVDESGESTTLTVRGAGKIDRESR